MSDSQTDATNEADQPAEGSDRGRPPPWTTKHVPTDARSAAIAAAKREGVGMGEWLARAIRQKIQSDRQTDRAPVPVGPAKGPPADLSKVERMVTMQAQLAQASGEPTPKGMVRLANAVLRDRLKAARG